MPLFTTAQISTAIRAVSTATQGGAHLEVFQSYIANPQAVSEGIYIARVYQADRIKSNNGITPGGHIYFIKDRIEMYLMTSQDNPFVEGLLSIFPTFLDNALFNGYHLREHTIDQVYANNSERYKIIFDLTRLQTI
jgi:hypothetical protein